MGNKLEEYLMPLGGCRGQAYLGFQADRDSGFPLLHFSTTKTEISHFFGLKGVELR